ncbi:MAG: LysR family transcriptional regulator [Pantoea sp.]|nr:LysR family transcriptional regulator [Pantoea sp.]
MDLPPVSKALRDLEDHLGVKLIQRTTRTITLSTEGAEYYRRISRLMVKCDETESGMRDMAAAARGRLPFLMACFLIGWLKA